MFDPFKKQLNLPSCLVNISNFDALGADAARELANSRAWEELVVYVRGGVDKVVAEAIAHYQGQSIHLAIDNQPETIRDLASFTGKLLVAIEHLTPEMATALAGCKCTHLSLPYLEHIDTNSAREISKIQCHRLTLEWLESLSASVARELVKYVEVDEEWISLTMPHCPEEFVNDAMTFMGGGNPPPRLVDDDRGIAKFLANPRRLWLQGLTASELSGEVREVFAPHKAKVVLQTEIDDDAEWMEDTEEPLNHTHKDDSRDQT